MVLPKFDDRGKRIRCVNPECNNRVVDNRTCDGCLADAEERRDRMTARQRPVEPIKQLYL